MSITKKFLICLMSILTALQSTALYAFADENSSSLCELRYCGISAISKKDVSCVYVKTEWSDDYLGGDSSVYCHSLSKALLLLSSGAYYGSESNESDLIYNFESLGFYDIEHNYKPTGLNYDKTSEYYDEDGISYGFAKKETVIGGKNTTIVGVVVKGTSNEEWIGNFNIGEGEEHRGFSIAAQKMLLPLKNYISEHCAGDNIKMFITGHSRGASVANLLCAELDKEIKSGTFDLPKSDLFCYTFSTPTVTTAEDAESDDYSNIFNINNPNDVITYLPLPQWGYKRYGTDIFFPDLTSNTNFAELKAKVNKEFKELTGISDCLICENGNADILSYLSGLNSLVASTHDYYNKKYTMNREQKTTAEFVSSVTALLAGSTGDRISAITSLAPALKSPFGLFANFLVKNILSSSGAGAVVFNHAPETQIAYLFALDEEELLSTKLTKKISFDSQCDVSVTDNLTGEVIAEINDGAYVPPEKLMAIKRTDNFIDLYLPSDGRFSVKISNAPKRKLDISYCIFKLDGTAENIAYYSDISLNPGDTVTVDTYELVKQIDVRSSASGKTVLPSYSSFDKAQPEYCALNAQKEGTGDFLCASSCARGSILSLKAYETDGRYAFAGYDINGFHASKNRNFSLIANDIKSVKCVFLNMGELITGDCNNDEKITMEDVVLVQKYIAKLNSLNTRGVYSADVNGDGNISMLDVTNMQLYIAKLIDTFAFSGNAD